MTVVADTLKAQVARVGNISKPQPTLFDFVAWYEPSAHFRYTRGIRKAFEELAREYAKTTLLLGRFGGRPVMQTDIQGIGVASRVEVGRLSLLNGHRPLIENVFEMFRDCQQREFVSGPLDRMNIHFARADQRADVRESARSAFSSVFDMECSFLAPDPDQPDHLVLGHCVTYQTLIQYLREDSVYHSVHRGRVERVSRHLHQEVGRYENHKFYAVPERRPGEMPTVSFCYTGAAPDRKVEAFMEGYTAEKLSYVPPDSFDAERHRYTRLKDYERASRRFGGLWILQSDLARRLSQPEVGALYLFLDRELQPQLDRAFSWGELFERLRASTHVDRASRSSETFLETVIESLVRKRFIAEAGERFYLERGFDDYQHVTFYELGEYRKNLQ